MEVSEILKGSKMSRFYWHFSSSFWEGKLWVLSAGVVPREHGLAKSK